MPKSRQKTQKIKKFPRSLAVFLMLVNTVSWGAALPIVKPALSFITPFQFLFFRYVFAALFSLPLLFYYLPKIKHIWRSIGIIIVLELIGTTTALGLLYKGLEYTTSVQASLIATTTPVFIILGGIVFLKEKEEKHEWIGLGLAIIGTLLLTLEPLFLGKDGLGNFSVVGNTLIMGQNLATAAYFLLAKKLYKTIPPLFATTISYYVGILSFGTIILLDHSSFNLMMVMNNSSALIAVLYMATFGSIIGLTAYLKGQQGMEASEASMFTYLQPLVFIPLSFLMLGETISGLTILSIVLIGGGVWFSEYRGKR
jgi:drug/metabolite transporter (DMT)-like permease